nr:hypothetical protein CFP56_54474 [Quercus suber]
MSLTGDQVHLCPRTNVRRQRLNWKALFRSIEASMRYLQSPCPHAQKGQVRLWHVDSNLNPCILSRSCQDEEDASLLNGCGWSIRRCSTLLSVSRNEWPSHSGRVNDNASMRRLSCLTAVLTWSHIKSALVCRAAGSGETGCFSSVGEADQAQIFLVLVTSTLARAEALCIPCGMS